MLHQYLLFEIHDFLLIEYIHLQIYLFPFVQYQYVQISYKLVLLLQQQLLLLMIFRYIRNEDEYEENWVEELRKLCIK